MASQDGHHVTTRPQPIWLPWLIAAIALNSGSVRADIQFSGFGTLGGAISDQDFTYQRHLDRRGTLSRDSMVGIQLDADLSDSWRLTLQGKAAPSGQDDNAWEPSLTWAFLSWRPTNEVLLRAGKIRLPLLLYSANSDVGITFDFARLPAAVYSLLPTTDVNGLALSKSWLGDDYEWSLEGYAGQANTHWRYFLRGSAPGLSAGANYFGYDIRSAGLAASLRYRKHSLRLGLHRATAEWSGGRVPRDFPYVAVAPGVGYYQVADQLPGPGIPYIDRYDFGLITLGADLALPGGVRLVGEYGQRRIGNATMGPDTDAAYLSLLKPVGRWTPYIRGSVIRSKDKPLKLWSKLNGAHIHETTPGSASINAAQRTAADLLSAYDEDTWAIGASYSLSPTRKVKAEWMHVRTGRVSAFVDSPPEGDSGGRQVDVLSLSYNVAF